MTMARCPCNKISGYDFLSLLLTGVWLWTVHWPLIGCDAFSDWVGLSDKMTLFHSAFSLCNGGRNEWTNIWAWILVLIVQLSEYTGAQVKEDIKYFLPQEWPQSSYAVALVTQPWEPGSVCTTQKNTMLATQKRHTNMTSYGPDFGTPAQPCYLLGFVMPRGFKAYWVWTCWCGHNGSITLKWGSKLWIIVWSRYETW